MSHRAPTRRPSPAQGKGRRTPRQKLRLRTQQAEAARLQRWFADRADERRRKREEAAKTEPAPSPAAGRVPASLVKGNPLQRRAIPNTPDEDPRTGGRTELRRGRWVTEPIRNPAKDRSLPGRRRVRARKAAQRKAAS